jgi:hypothetical protein
MGVCECCGESRGHLPGCDSGARQNPAPPPADPGKAGAPRRSRRKGSIAKPGEIILAEHNPIWALVGGMMIDKRYVYLWRCGVSGCARTDTSRKASEQPAGRCPARYKN